MSVYIRGIETEKLYENGKEAEIITPFDPKLVDIESKPMVLSNIVDRLKNDGIVLDPNFQRNPDLWDKQKQSRLIESLLIRIPLPIFYFDMSEDEKLIVVDGLQRLSAIKNFMATASDEDNCLRLQGLEYLKELEGKSFDELAPNLQRRLREQTIQVYLIKAGTPDNVKNSIFERINTGGLILTSAEIKNSVYRGRASELLKNMAETKEFVEATNKKITPTRMLDREFANRFLAFYLLDIKEYHENLDDFMREVLSRVKNDNSIDCDLIVAAYKKALKLASDVFGKNAFKRIGKNGKYTGINKPLFEAVTVQFAVLSDIERKKLIKNKEKFLTRFNKLLCDEKFIEVITNGTARLTSVKYRHGEIERIIGESLEK